jgi:cardiolipin synthase
MYRLADYAKWISIGFTVVAVIMALFIIWRDFNPAYKIGWILLICLLPVMGVALYGFFGNKRPSKSLKRRLDQQEKIHREDLNKKADIRSIASPRLQRTSQYITDKGPYPPWLNTTTRYLSCGRWYVCRYAGGSEKREHFIFMEYFIIAKGWLWDQIFEILKEKTKAQDLTSGSLR